MILQGDSRRLREVLGPVLAECCVGESAVCVSETVNDRNGIDMSRTRIGSRPGGPTPKHGQRATALRPGQLGQMREGSIDAVITSPPYAEIATGAGGLNTRPHNTPVSRLGVAPASASQDTDQRYGESEGQLARMDLGDVSAIVSVTLG